MWIKASGTELAQALEKDIFVAVDPQRALAELDGIGDGSCRSALVDPDCGLRPSIETTFHAMFPQKFVFHYHSVGTICHSICSEGRQELTEKLDGVSWVNAPYRKPGVPLTKAIQDSVAEKPDAEVVILQNHGVIVVAETIDRINELIELIEARLELVVSSDDHPTSIEEFAGWTSLPCSSLAKDPAVCKRAAAGSYYPDHVVFLGPAMPICDRDEFAKANIDDWEFPVVIVRDLGVYAKSDASETVKSMAKCLADVLTRIPDAWTLQPIGEQAEAKLLNWDAEKYRQMLAQRTE